MYVYFISPPSLSLIGLLTTEYRMKIVYKKTMKTHAQTTQNETDTLPIYHIGSSN